MLKLGFRTLAACFVILAMTSARLSADDKDDREMKLGKQTTITAPEGWKKKTPRFARIVMYEYAAPAVKGDQADGRLTVGVLGSSIDANIQRWLGQITQPDGGDTAKRQARHQDHRRPQGAPGRRLGHL